MRKLDNRNIDNHTKRTDKTKLESFCRKLFQRGAKIHRPKAKETKPIKRFKEIKQRPLLFNNRQ